MDGEPVYGINTGVGRLTAGSAIRASHLVADARVQDPYCLRCQPQVMGAARDLLRYAATTLDREANGVTDNPLIFPQADTALSGGKFHAEPVAFAADTMAIAVCEIGSLAERRVAMLVDPDLSRLPAFLTPDSGLNSGLMLPQITAAALVSENKQRAYPASVDSIPTSANQEDHVSMSAHGARRLLPMAGNAAAIVGIEAGAPRRDVSAFGNGYPARHRAVPHLAVNRAEGCGLVGAPIVRRPGRCDARPHVNLAYRHRRESRPFRRLALSRPRDDGPLSARDVRWRAALPAAPRAR